MNLFADLVAERHYWPDEFASFFAVFFMISITQLIILHLHSAICYRVSHLCM